MKYIMRKKSKRKVSPVVLRAIARINEYENKKENYSVFCNQKSINYLSITS
tara:strand:+ start:80 stop:232 length:153 start_codon:yes stop_codon:yes gene_type:complete